MKIIAEASVPYLRGIAEQYAEVIYLDNTLIDAEHIRDADALLVRSITKCNATLLEGSQVRYIATATAGSDHIDEDYCAQNGIQWTNAPGCNAMGVAQYVCSSLYLLQLRHRIALRGKKIGIIGVGHVGSLVREIAVAMGMIPILYDPPKYEREGDKLPHREEYSSLEALQHECDIITLHVPLTKSGKYPTQGMVDRTFLDQCKPGLILINACRGAVTQTESLIQAKEQGQISYLIIDCWEHEPLIDTKLLRLADVATPHIAGFSADGKHRGARMALLAISNFFKLGATPELLIPTELNQPTEPIDLGNFPKGERIARAQLTSFNPTHINACLKSEPLLFEHLRKHYDYPREMSAYIVTGGTADERATLSAIGFQTESITDEQNGIICQP